MKHQCTGCRYFYETDCVKTETRYDALFDAVRIISVKVRDNCCGLTPGGLVLDKEQPRCSCFKETR